MRLISCPVCSNPVSFDADACPRCAHPDPSSKKRNASIRGRVIGAVIVVVAGSYLWFVQLPQVFSFFQP